MVCSISRNHGDLCIVAYGAMHGDVIVHAVQWYKAMHGAILHGHGAQTNRNRIDCIVHSLSPVQLCEAIHGKILHSAFYLVYVWCILKVNNFFVVVYCIFGHVAFGRPARV